MTKKSGKRNSGFSLIELLIVMAMLALVLTSVYSVYTVQSRSAAVQDEVGELQQNIRIGLDQMSRDIMMAGFLACPAPVAAPVTAVGANDGLNNSDSITMAMSSTSVKSARIMEDVIVAGPSNAFVVETPDDVDKFANETEVRIVSADVKGIKQNGAVGPFPIVSTNKATKEITLSGLTASNEYHSNDMIISAKGGWPSSIKYCLGSKTYGPCMINMCPENQSCLGRVEDGGAPILVATNMTNLQFQYLLKDSYVPVEKPTDFTKVRAVRVSLTGQTVVTKAMTGQPKTRQMVSVVDLRNADKPCPSAL